MQTSQFYVFNPIEPLQKFLDDSVRNLRYQSGVRSTGKFNNILDQLNRAPSNILSQLPSHKFYIILRTHLRDLLNNWSFLSNEESELLGNSIRFFDRLVKIVGDVTTMTPWLIERSFINSFAQCLSNIDRVTDRYFLKQLIRLFDVFQIFYERFPVKFTDENELDRLFEATMDCLLSSKYDQAFRNVKPKTRSMNSEQKFFLIKCPSLIISYQGKHTPKMIEQILETMIPRYALLLDEYIQSMNQWNPPLIHAVHHMFLTVIYAKGSYTSYATGQPIQWLIDHIIRILSESTFRKKVNEESTTPETILIDSALRTLTAFVHEPDLLGYLKHLKIISLFHSLTFLHNESIVLHAYVMLSYTLDEDDIKASEKDFGRLLLKIFDSLRKKLRSLSISNQTEEIIEKNITLLAEAVRALVQHDQIKSEIIKQNALSLLTNGYQHMHHRSKRLLLESLGSITFDKEAARLLRHDTQFIDSVKDIQTTNDDGLNKAADKIIWNLIKEPEKEKQIEEEKKQKEDQTKKTEYQYDIMISYCHADKEIVYRIHKFLSEKGFKIWFDRDNIYGPAMQAMADAVENSEFVLLCISDSYKRSVYCQAEAEYAFRCKRHLLPCIVREGYRADGWLGLLISSRIYTDFGRLDFKSACELVLKEITLQREGQLTKGKETTEQEGKLNLPGEYLNRQTSQSTYRSISMEQWTKKDVLDYLYDRNLYYMMPICELMTGLGLMKLFRICRREPSRFYRQLNEEVITRFSGLHLPIGIFTQFLSEMDRSLKSTTIATIELDAGQSKSNSPSSSSSPSSAAMITQTQSPPSVTTIQTSRNVRITEKTAYKVHSQ